MTVHVQAALLVTVVAGVVLHALLRGVAGPD